MYRPPAFCAILYLMNEAGKMPLKWAFGQGFKFSTKSQNKKHLHSKCFFVLVRGSMKRTNAAGICSSEYAI